MQFTELEWIDQMSDDMIISSSCNVKVYGYNIKIEFRITYERNEDKYYLYSFGKGSIRRLMPDVFSSIDEAKAAAYQIYNKEMIRMKKAIDSWLIDDES